jgi:hypothetical protein
LSDVFPISPDYSKSSIEVLVDVLRNQHRHQEDHEAEDNYEMLAYLLKTLQVSGVELARYLLQHDPSMVNYFYLLVSSDIMVATMYRLDTIQIGIFQHINGRSRSEIKRALSDSDMFSYMSRSVLQTLVSSLAEPSPALDLEFRNSGMDNDTILNGIESSTRSLMGTLCSKPSRYRCL